MEDEDDEDLAAAIALSLAMAGGEAGDEVSEAERGLAPWGRPRDCAQSGHGSVVAPVGSRAAGSCRTSPPSEDRASKSGAARKCSPTTRIDIDSGGERFVVQRALQCPLPGLLTTYSVRRIHTADPASSGAPEPARPTGSPPPAHPHRLTGALSS